MLTVNLDSRRDDVPNFQASQDRGAGPGQLTTGSQKIRRSEAAVSLKKRERALWNELCSDAAGHILSVFVTKEGKGSRAPKLKPIVERRIPIYFTRATSAFLPAALLAASALGTPEKLRRPGVDVPFKCCIQLCARGDI
jgi:hypothetical protein